MMSQEEKREILESIAKSNGGHLTPELVVAAARDPEHPLHSEFDWDDESAAHQHRLAIARRIIRSVRINVVVHNRVIPVCCYVHDPQVPAREQAYIALINPTRARKDAQTILLAELSRIEACIVRGKKVAAALRLEADFDALLAKLLTIRTKLIKVSSAA